MRQLLQLGFEVGDAPHDRAGGRSRAWSRRNRTGSRRRRAAATSLALMPRGAGAGSRYRSNASSTCALPSRVWAFWAKMSRITAVRSIAVRPSTFSRLNCCAGPARCRTPPCRRRPRGRCRCSSSTLPLPMNHVWSGWSRRCTIRPASSAPAVSINNRLIAVERELERGQGVDLVDELHQRIEAEQGGHQRAGQPARHVALDGGPEQRCEAQHRDASAAMFARVGIHLALGIDSVGQEWCAGQPPQRMALGQKVWVVEMRPVERGRGAEHQLLDAALAAGVEHV